MTRKGTPPGGAGGRAADESTTGTESGTGSRRGLLRRAFLGVLGGLGLGTGLGGTAAGAVRSTRGTDTTRAGLLATLRQRVTSEFRTRRDYSRAQLIEDADTTAHAANGRLAEDAVVAKYGKALEHDERTGLPTTAAYDSLVAACESGEGFQDIRQADLSDADDVSRSTLVDRELNPRPLAQPETAWTYTTEGASTATLRIATPPAFDDPETGAEMVELYWRALTRDVPFRAYEDSELVAAAAAELDGLDAYAGPGADGTVTPGNVFRGVTPGATTGPYVSQFLWKDRNLGRGPEDQKIQPQIAESTPADYVTSLADWRKVQRGVAPALDDSLPGNEYDDDRRYIVTGRDMCERVHDDPPYRQVQKAAQVLLFTMNAPLDEGIPYTLKPFEKPSPSRRDVDSFTAQTTLPFNDFGPLYVEKKVLEATEHGQKAAWHKKWNVHRRLRPEEYGGRVQAQLGEGLSVADLDADDTGNGAGGGPGSGSENGEGEARGKGNSRGGGNDSGDGNGPSDSGGSGSDAAAGSTARYPIPENLLDSAALARTKERFGTYLLPQAYAEGSPTHPSYPAGHSVVAGAGVTVLKALFDGDYEIPADQKVVPTDDGTALRTATELSGDVMGVTDTLTVRGELNKLASNMALGRNRAGIHYRTDGIEGLRLGERTAIRFLEDQLTLPTRAAQLADGGRLELTLETFDGERVTVTPSV